MTSAAACADGPPKSASTGPDAMRGTGEDEISDATGWTISGIATLGTIVAIWLPGI